MEFGRIQFQKNCLIIVSGIIRFSWTLIILTSGIILLVQETSKIFGDWENSYWPFGIFFVILFGYGIFSVGLQFKVFLHLKSELKSPSITSGAGGYGDDPDSFGLTTMITEEDNDDNDEPLPSGFGDVSKECSGTELDSWSQVLSEWSRDNPKQYPKSLLTLIKNGVPETF